MKFSSHTNLKVISIILHEKCWFHTPRNHLDEIKDVCRMRMNDKIHHPRKPHYVLDKWENKENSRITQHGIINAFHHHSIISKISIAIHGARKGILALKCTGMKAATMKPSLLAYHGSYCPNVCHHRYTF